MKRRSFIKGLLGLVAVPTVLKAASKFKVEEELQPYQKVYKEAQLHIGDLVDIDNGKIVLATQSTGIAGVWDGKKIITSRGCR